MSAVKKKQEEKNLRILRELLTFENNKYCFDCNQRGPTYVNMTIGSFVCTNCGGALRKYNHRVKSISMSNFSQSEMDFIKKRGNNICKRIFYGLCDNNVAPSDYDSKNGMLDSHLRSKYELKKWYIEPTTEMEEEAIRINQMLYDKVDKPLTNSIVKSAQRININASSSMIIEAPRVSAPTSSAVVSSNKINKISHDHGHVDPSKLGGGSAIKLPIPPPSMSNSAETATTTTTLSGVTNKLQNISTPSLFDDSDNFINANHHQPAQQFNQHPPSTQPTLPTLNPLVPINPINNGYATSNQTHNNISAQNMNMNTDKYAALAELDDLFSHASIVSSASSSQPSSTNYNWNQSVGLSQQYQHQQQQLQNHQLLQQQQQHPVSNPFNNPFAPSSSSSCNTMWPSSNMNVPIPSNTNMSSQQPTFNPFITPSSANNNITSNNNPQHNHNPFL